MKNSFGVRIKECDSSSTAHTDVLADGDEFAAAFESRAAHFELYDDVRFLLSIDDEESISEPQVIR